MGPPELGSCVEVAKRESELFDDAYHRNRRADAVARAELDLLADRVAIRLRPPSVCRFLIHHTHCRDERLVCHTKPAALDNWRVKRLKEVPRYAPSEVALPIEEIGCRGELLRADGDRVKRRWPCASARVGGRVRQDWRSNDPGRRDARGERQAVDNVLLKRPDAPWVVFRFALWNYVPEVHYTLRVEPWIE